jgi:hypothetical protein
MVGVLTPTVTSERAQKINACWYKSVEGVMEAGLFLNQAKAELPHGKFLPLLKLLDFDADTAEDVMWIAKHPRLSDSANFRNLPRAVSTLLLLADLTVEQYDAMAAAGHITPRLRRHQLAIAVAAFSKVSKPQKPKPAPSDKDLNDLATISAAHAKALRALPPKVLSRELSRFIQKVTEAPDQLLVRSMMNAGLLPMGPDNVLIEDYQNETETVH